MKRRELLGRVAALGVAGAIAGCVQAPETGDPGGPGGGGGDGGGTDGGGTDGSDGTDGGGTDGGDGTDGGGGGDGSPPSIVDSAIRTTRADCGASGVLEASVEYGDDRVRIGGAFSTPDPCHEAVLESVRYDAATDRLTVSVGAVGTDEMCIQCVGVVVYDAEVRFEGGLPGSVTVRHGGETVTTDARSG